MAVWLSESDKAPSKLCCILGGVGVFSLEFCGNLNWHLAVGLLPRFLCIRGLKDLLERFRIRSDSTSTMDMKHAAVSWAKRLGFRDRLHRPRFLRDHERDRSKLSETLFGKTEISERPHTCRRPNRSGQSYHDTGITIRLRVGQDRHSRSVTAPAPGHGPGITPGRRNRRKFAWNLNVLLIPVFRGRRDRALCLKICTLFARTTSEITNLKDIPVQSRTRRLGRLRSCHDHTPSNAKIQLPVCGDGDGARRAGPRPTADLEKRA